MNIKEENYPKINLITGFDDNITSFLLNFFKNSKNCSLNAYKDYIHNKEDKIDCILNIKFTSNIFLEIF